MRVYGLSLSFLFAASTALGGAPHAGMGGGGTGNPGPTGDLSDNPAAAAAAADRDEGVLHVGGNWQSLVFSGRALNPVDSTVARYQDAEGLSWGIVTPELGLGRLGLGAWQVDRRVLEIEEDLPLATPFSIGGAPIGADHEKAWTNLSEDEGVWAVGAAWITALASGQHNVALGTAYMVERDRSKVEAFAVRRSDGGTEALRRLRIARDLDGFAFLFGYLYRPMPEGSLGFSVMSIGELAGPVLVQADGEPLYRDELVRPGKLIASVGGAVTILGNITAAVDFRYSEDSVTTATLFKDTPVQVALLEKSEAVFSVSGGLEYRLHFHDKIFPLRIGFFTRPDSQPASRAGVGIPAVAALVPVPFRQDVTGYTFGTGWEYSALRLDLAVVWMQVNTRTNVLSETGATVESGDVRNGVGVVGSMSLIIGGLGFE